VRRPPLFVTGRTLMVLTAAIVVTAAILLTVFATIFPAILTPIFSTVLTAVFTTRGLVRLTRHRGGRQQRARDENCTEQL